MSNDTLNFYLPGTDLAMGSVMHTTSAVLDQSAFDTITFSAKAAGKAIDEIRFGATYDDVIGKVIKGGTAIIVY